VGAGLSFPALMTLAMSSARPTDAGLASGLVNTTQQVGGALGLAVLATVSASHTLSLLHDGHSTASALTGGYHLAWVIGTGLLVAAVATAIAVLHRRPSWRRTPIARRSRSTPRQRDLPGGEAAKAAR
jgi:MFS family permease